MQKKICASLNQYSENTWIGGVPGWWQPPPIIWDKKLRFQNVSLLLFFLVITLLLYQWTISYTCCWQNSGPHDNVAACHVRGTKSYCSGWQYYTHRLTHTQCPQTAENNLNGKQCAQYSKVAVKSVHFWNKAWHTEIVNKWHVISKRNIYLMQCFPMLFNPSQNPFKRGTLQLCWAVVKVIY